MAQEKRPEWVVTLSGRVGEEEKDQEEGSFKRAVYAFRSLRITFWKASLFPLFISYIVQP